MKFSKKFLDKLLKSAVSFHNTEEECSVLPPKFTSLQDAINKLERVIKFEANKALQNEILVDSPILHAINLNTKYPGIIFDEKDKKVIVHKEKKEVKPKTEEQIAKEMEQKILNDQKKEENKKIRQEEREEKKELKQEGKELKSMEKKLTKKEKDIDKKTKRKNRIEKKIEKNHATEEDKQLYDDLENDLEKTEGEYKEMEEEYETRNNEYQKRSDDYNEIQEQRRMEKEEKIKKKEEKKLEREEKNRIKKDKVEKKLAEEERQYMEQLFDLQHEEISNEDLEDMTEIDSSNIKIYESPLPFQRHLESLEYVDLNNNLLMTVLKGIKPQNGYNLQIFHGPPGTGKTYKLIQMLSELLKKTNLKHKYLICAPSNIGTLNLYNRAKSFNIHGNLILSKTKEINADEVKNSNVYFSTVSMRYGNLMKDLPFHTIMMDEAAQCQESWTWGLLRSEVKNIFLAGDPHQLPAVVSDEGNKLNHSRSLMSRLMQIGYPSKLLDVQRRMHPDIVKFSNEQYYEGKLKTDYKGSDIKLNPFEIIDIKGEEERIGTSYQNKIEAEKVVELVKELDIENTVIISPYQAQCKLLKTLNNNLEIHTVDSFQGREADAIILTTVRSDDKVGFWNDYRRLNVGLTRARHVLRIVGNVDTWKKQDGPLKLLAESI